MLARSLETLLARLIDYAGLFPPAALPMEQAIDNYRRYRDGDYAWMLGRFIVPEANAAEVPDDIPKSVIGIDEVTERRRPGGRTSGVPPLYVETTNLDLIPELAADNLRAKLRTGGLTPDAFPSTKAIADFLKKCAEHGVPFKATAGLHHPVRCVRPLTYEPDAPRGTMHGFINLFMAAALLPHAEEILEEEDPHAFAFDDDTASWRGHAVLTQDLEKLRNEFAISFGSCSFEEPIDDLKELGWLD